MRRLVGSLFLLLALACAREEPPPGTHPDFSPPRAVGLFPEYGAAVPGFDGDAVIRFDEPLADPRGVERLLAASPADRFRVRPGRRHLRIRPVDGWRADAVYYIRIPPGLRDLLRNPTAEPVELLFTTGPELAATRAAGRLYDRIRVQGVRDARLLFLATDSIPYTAVSDTGGTFAIPSLPPGDYWVFGFQDQNRNLRLDREFEPHDSTSLKLEDATSRVLDLELWMVPPDSTPPFLFRAQAVDTARLELEFDELLEPEFPLDSARVTIRDEDTGTERSVVRLTIGRPDARRPSRRPGAPARADADSLREAIESDTTALGVGADVEVTRPEDGDGKPTGGTEAQELPRKLPSQYVMVDLSPRLRTGTYRVHVAGFANLRGLLGGGDTTIVYTEPATPASPQPDAAPPALPPDSAELEPDSAELEPDSIPEG